MSSLHEPHDDDIIRFQLRRRCYESYDTPQQRELLNDPR